MIKIDANYDGIRATAKKIYNTSQVPKEEPIIEDQDVGIIFIGNSDK